MLLVLGTLLGKIVVEKENLMAKWELIAPAIKDPFYAEALVFQGGAGMVLGYRAPSETGLPQPERMARWEAIILRLAPGASTWEQVFRGRGHMLHASVAGPDVIHALGESFFRDGTAAQFVETSVDGGATWKPGPPPPDGAVGLSMKVDGSGWAWTRRAVYSTSDAGKTWQEVVQLAEDRFSAGRLAPAFDAAGGVWVPDGFRVARVLGDEVEEFPFPDGTELDALAVAPDGAAWIAARAGSDGPIRVHRLVPGHEPELLAELARWLPVRLHVGKELALLATCDVGEGDRAPTYFMLASRDGGRTWTREKPAKESVLRPLYFENDEVVWAYANFGRIQRRTPR